MENEKYPKWRSYAEVGRCYYYASPDVLVGTAYTGLGCATWRVHGTTEGCGVTDTLEEAVAMVETVYHGTQARPVAPFTDAGAKHDAGKLPWNLVPFRQLESIVAVYRYGAEKYGADTWQTVPNARERYFAALMRHLTAWRTGESTDAESGLPHLAHVAWGAIALMWLDGEQK